MKRVNKIAKLQESYIHIKEILKWPFHDKRSVTGTEMNKKD